MLKTHYMYQVKMLYGETYRQEIRYYENKKDLNDFDLCDLPNFHEGQAGMFLRKDAMFMGAIDMDFDKPIISYHAFPKNNNIVELPFILNGKQKKLENTYQHVAIKSQPAISKKKHRPVKPWLLPLRANIIAPERCTYCGNVLSNRRGPNMKTRDHVYPLSKFGLNIKSNLVPCCSNCNSLKDDMLIEDFLTFLKSMLSDYDAFLDKNKPPEMSIRIMICNVQDFIDTHCLEMTPEGKYFYNERDLIVQE